MDSPYLWNRSKCPISINGNVIEGNEWNVNVPRKSFPTYQAIIIIDWDYVIKVCWLLHYTVSSILCWVLQHTAADLPMVAGVSRVSSAVCVPGPGPAPGHSKWLTPTPSFTANCNYCRPVTFPSLQACYRGSTLWSSPPILPALFLESLNYWLKNLKLWQVVSGEAVATQRWLRLWPRLNLTSLLFSANVMKTILLQPDYDHLTATVSVSQATIVSLGPSVEMVWLCCQLFCIKIQSI